MRFFQKRALNIVFLSVCCVLLSFAACGTEEGNITEEPTEKPTPTPKFWIAQLVEEGRTELSREHIRPYENEGFFKHPVSVTKTVRLGDFEYTMTVPKAIFRLADLKNGVDVFETTSTLKYIGEEESIRIASRERPITDLIMDPEGNREDDTGGFDTCVYTELKKDEEIKFTKVYDTFSKEVDSLGAGVIVTIVEFRVVDENGKTIWDEGRYLLSIPFDVVE